MPYICLARDDIPDGVVQILDIAPNTSLRNQIYDPQGQTRYVNRLQDNLVYFTAAGGIVMNPVDGLKAYLVDRVEPGPDSVGVSEWTQAHQAAVAAGLVARLDAGLSMTLAAVNAVIQATFPASDLDGTASNSTGVLTELLAIFSGRGYRLPAGGIVPKGPTGVWSNVILGSFTEAVLVFGDAMSNGEIKPNNIGGDVENREYKGIRYTALTGAFLISVNQGAMGVLSHKAGLPHPTLWPDSDQEPRFPWTYQNGQYWPPVIDARVITVYDDTGAVL